MIQSFSLSQTPSILTRMEPDPIMPLEDHIKQSDTIISASPENSSDFDGDPLGHIFLEALLQLPSSDNPQSYADAVSKLMRTFIDPTTGKLAFSTLDQQVDILQRTLKKVGTNDKISEPLTATLLGTSNLQFQMTKWMQDTILSGGETEEFEDW